MPFEQAYTVGVYGHGALYNIAYLIARDPVADLGSVGISSLLTQPSYRFILPYADLPQYGKGGDHPKLGLNTIAAAKALAEGYW